MSTSLPIALQDFKDKVSATDEITLELESAHQTDDSFDMEAMDMEAKPKFTISREFGLTLFVLWTGNFLCSLDGTIVSTTMSNIAADFDQSDMVTWIATSYLLTSTAFQPLYGKTSDILGRKTLLLLAQVIFTLGTLLSAMAVNVQTLSIARAISGIGGAGMGALTGIIISDVVPLSQRSVFVGYGTIISSTSQMLGGPIGGLCIVTIGWRWMFLIQLPFLIIVILVLSTSVEIRVEHIPEGAHRFSKENLQRIDIGGIITLNLAVSSIIFLFSQTENTTNLYRWFFSLLLVASSIAYLYVEKYIAVEKIIDPELLKGQVGILGFTNGVSALSLYMVLFVTPLYLQIVQDVAVTNIGYYTMFFVVSSAIGSLIAGYMIRKHDESELQTMIAAVSTSLRFFGLQTLGFLLLSLVVMITTPDNGSAIWRLCLLGGLVVGGLGAGGYSVGTVIFVIGKVGRRGQASANTVVSLIRQLGNVLGVSISLSSYTRSVSSGLHTYFKDNVEYVEILVRDSSFVRNGLPSEFAKDVLQIYKRAVNAAFIPAMILTLCGLGVMFVLNRKVKKIDAPVLH